MPTIEEERERVKEMYRSIKTPWQYPKFPDPPAEFLPPRQFVDLLKEAILVHHTKINHPFCVKLFRGEWTKRQLHEWVKQEYHGTVQTLRNDAYIVANGATVDEIRKQITVLVEEAGEDLFGGKYPAHPELFIRFGEGLGLKRAEIMNSEPSALMELILDNERYRGLRLTIGGIPPNLRLGERINAIIFPIWADILQEKYGVAREPLEFFYAHAVDVDHGKVGEDLVLSRVTTPEAQRAIWLHQKKGQAKQWINFDVYYQAAAQANGN